MNEFELIRRYFTRPPRHSVLGVGDDAAIFRPSPGCELLVSSDMLVEGRHFSPAVAPEALGHKTLAVNLSDIAAMGGVARWALLSLALPDADPCWAQGFAHGLFALADRAGVDLIGGDTTRGPLTLSVTIIGEAPFGQALRRSGAQAGDDIWVSGELGDAALALATAQGRVDGLSADVRAHAQQRLDFPEPRLALGLALRGVASAAIDVSDGLLADLGHLVAASGLGAEVWLPALPCSAAVKARLQAWPELAAAGGDDYELCFTAPPAARTALAQLAAGLGLALTRIGRTEHAPGCRLRDAAGRPVLLQRQGYDHFQ